MVRALVELGANLEAPTYDQGWTPLFLATIGRSEATIRVLAELGANLEATGNDGFTPLCLAVLSGDEATVRVLAELGANLKATSNSGKTPLQLAVGCRSSCTSALRELIAMADTTAVPAAEVRQFQMALKGPL
jgi:ankyrin repeat protein